MLKPTSSEIQSYAADYSMIPLCREIYADVTTPIALLRKIAQVSNRYCLLESVEGGERWGRYSFLGYDPLVHIVCKDHVVTTEYADGRRESVTTDQPNDILRALMAQYKAPRIEGFPPFTGGLVGYYAYRMIGYAEPTLHLRSSDVDDFDLMLFDKVIAFDNLRQKIILIANMSLAEPEVNYSKAVLELKQLAQLLRTGEKRPNPAGDSPARSRRCLTRPATAPWWSRTNTTSARAIFFRWFSPTGSALPMRAAC